MDEKMGGQERNREKRSEESYEENKNEIENRIRLVRGNTSRKIKVWKILKSSRTRNEGIN
jgi:hypothetical protein